MKGRRTIRVSRSASENIPFLSKKNMGISGSNKTIIKTLVVFWTIYPEIAKKKWKKLQLTRTIFSPEICGLLRVPETFQKWRGEWPGDNRRKQLECHWIKHWRNLNWKFPSSRGISHSTSISSWHLLWRKRKVSVMTHFATSTLWSQFCMLRPPFLICFFFAFRCFASFNNSKLES